MQQYDNFSNNRSKKGVSAALGTLLITLVTTTGGVTTYVFTDNVQSELIEGYEEKVKDLVSLSDDRSEQHKDVINYKLKEEQDNAQTRNLLVCSLDKNSGNYECSMAEMMTGITEGSSIVKLMEDNGE